MARESIPLNGDPVTSKDMLRGMMTYIWPKVCLFIAFNLYHLRIMLPQWCMHACMGVAVLVLHCLQYKYQYWQLRIQLPVS
jgi:hypothetical protein